MSGNPKQNDNEHKPPPLPELPPPPNVRPPEISEIRPQVKQALDTMVPRLNKQELNYLLHLIRMKIGTAHPNPTASNSSTRQEVIHPVKEVQQALDDIKKAEEYFTSGYTVQYPPKAVVPLAEGNFGAMDILDLILQRLDPVLRSPRVQDQVARLIGAVVDKLEGGKP
jgi:hypothetical protein